MPLASSETPSSAADLQGPTARPRAFLEMLLTVGALSLASLTCTTMEASITHISLEMNVISAFSAQAQVH